MARLAWVGVILVVACTAPPASPTRTPGQPTPTPRHTTSGQPTPTSEPTLSFEPSASTPVSLAFPRVAEERLVEGRYSSTPPFGVPFTFEVIGNSWESGHLHADFFDLLQFDDAAPGVPTRWVARLRLTDERPNTQLKRV